MAALKDLTLKDNGHIFGAQVPEPGSHLCLRLIYISKYIYILPREV